MTIVNCNFYDYPESSTGTLTIERWGFTDAGNVPLKISEVITNGQVSFNVVAGVYLITAITSKGRVFYSQRVSVPDSPTPVNLWTIAADTSVPPSEIDQSISAIATKLSGIPSFVSSVASQVPITGAQEKKQVFTQADLNVSGLLIVLHNFGKSPRSVRLIDSGAYEVMPDDVQDNGTTTTVINLNSLQPIAGTWTAILGG